MEQNFLSKKLKCGIIIAQKSRKCNVKFDMHRENKAGKDHQMIQSHNKISSHHSHMATTTNSSASFFVVLASKIEGLVPDMSTYYYSGYLMHHYQTLHKAVLLLGIVG